MQVHKVQQGTPDWYALRSLRLTASHAQAIATAGKGLDTYINKLVLEQFIPQDRYEGAAMERGKLLEPTARAKYEFETGQTVVEVGFISIDEHTGCSPDGMVLGTNGIIEVKARDDVKHLNLLRGGAIDTATIWQIQMQLLITGADWCDFIAYNPNFKQSMLVRRITPDKAKQDKLKLGIEKGKKLLKTLLNDPVVKAEMSEKIAA